MVPVRKHIGVIVGSYSLKEGVRYHHFPKEKIKHYLMISVGGALFFEIDDVCSDVPGVPAGTLTFVNAQSSTTHNQAIHSFFSGGRGPCVLN